MNVRHSMGVLHSSSIENLFYDQIDLRLFYFDVTTRKRIITNEDYLLQFHFKKEPRWSIQI